MKNGFPSVASWTAATSVSSGAVPHTRCRNAPISGLPSRGSAGSGETRERRERFRERRLTSLRVAVRADHQDPSIAKLPATNASSNSEGLSPNAIVEDQRQGSRLRLLEKRAIASKRRKRASSSRPRPQRGTLETFAVWHELRHARHRWRAVPRGPTEAPCPRGHGSPAPTARMRVLLRSNARPHKTSEPRSAARLATRSAMRVLFMPGCREEERAPTFSVASTAARARRPRARDRRTHLLPADRSRIASRRVRP